MTTSSGPPPLLSFSSSDHSGIRMAVPSAMLVITLSAAVVGGSPTSVTPMVNDVLLLDPSALVPNTVMLWLVTVS
ncbi:hypothetical protein D3C84_868590 [compost metagenome]